MGARWRGHSHPDLFNMINSGPGPEASAHQTDYWNKLTDELGTVDQHLNTALANLKATWEGTASDNANTGMTPLRQWAQDAQTGSTVMGVSTQDQAQFIASARAEMPPPVEVTTPAPSTWDMAGAGVAAVLGNPGPAVAVAQQAADHEHQEAAQNAAEQKAVDTMVTYDSNSTWNRDTLGTFVPPPDVVVSTSQSGTSGAPGGAVGSVGAAGLYTPPGGTTASGTVTVPGSGGGGSTGGRALPPTPGAGVGAGAGSLPSSGSTSASSFLPPPTPGGGGGGTLPPGRTPAPGGPGGLPFSTGGSLPGGGGGDAERGTLPGQRGGLPGTGGFGPEGGRAGGSGGVPGGLEADGARAGAQTGRGLGAGGADGVLGRGGSAGTAGTPGRGGGTGGTPMGGAGGAGGDEDDEHYSPDYLLETTDVFGDDRMVSPAVIGEDSAIDEQ